MRKARRRTKQSSGQNSNKLGSYEHSLDLHGATKQEALERVEEALDRALLQGCSRIKIIHGIGSGAVREAVHGYLSGSRQVSEFHLDPANAGVTWVTI